MTKTHKITKMGKAPKPPKIHILLLNASLETLKTKNGFELLDCDAHRSILLKLKKDPNLFRPDIVHQCLLTLLDSPLNKSEKISIFVSTQKNVLIKINSKTRLPRTFRRFSGLMAQLLHKRKIRAAENKEVKLIQIIKNPITNHLPTNCLKIGTAMSGKLVKLSEFLPSLPRNSPVLWTIGAMAHGEARADFEEKSVSLSEFALSAATALSRICCSYEEFLGIL
ncbi:18S rRNA pseudouridine methyltransferase [Bonamia ostreae]|uniref:18S rRNA pseudouridine methyltransferase n=1 Tax=Bonamia ostreae TaxID=126728 RepID=A0ABV2AGL4_9EUKA